jgi:hypothetical protein
MTDITEPSPRTPRPAAWERFLFEPESTSTAALIRIGLGAVALLWALSLLVDIDPLLTDGALRYADQGGPGYWNPLAAIDAHSAPLVACLLLVVSSVATMVGYRTRLSSAVTTVLMLSLQRQAPLVFNSGDLLLRQVAIAVALAPGGYLLSVDARRAHRRATTTTAPPPTRAPWALRFLQLNLAVGYLLSAWAKARGATWNDGTAVARALRIVDVQRFAPPEWFMEQADLLNLLTWFTLGFETAFLFLVWHRRLRPWVLGVGIAFHLGIDVFFDVGFFTPALFLAYLAFLPPEHADRVVAWVEGRLRGLRRPRVGSVA